jgi:TP901 family phage tail tape measure protein
MSDFIAEARVLVTPDTTKFRGLLEAQLAEASSKPLVVPVTFTATGTEGAAAASKKAETAKQAETTATRALEKSELALVAAQEKALLSTTQLGAARARLTGAITAVKQAELGLAAAERSKNALLIEDAQATLALAEAEEIRARGVARTIILANAQEAALAKTAAAQTAAAKAAATQTKVEQEAAGVKQALVTATAAQIRGTAELAKIQTLAAKSATDLATAQLRTITAATEQGATQITAAAAVRTAAIAQEQLTLALSTGNVRLVQAAALTSLLATAHEAQALAALGATRAENAHAASLANVQKAGIASTAGLIGLRGAVLTAGAGFIAATVAFQAAIQSIQSAAQLEEELNVFRVTAGATADEMDRVAASAKALGTDLTLPGVTAQDAATAMLTLSKAGLSVRESIDGARGALALGVAAQTDFATSSELIASSLNTFRLNGRDAADVANLLAASANESQGSIEDMGLALKQAGAVAQLAGISIEDTLTILTQLSKAGLAGSDAGTSFRTALVRLIKPTKDVNAALEVLQVRLRDAATGAIRPEVFGEIGEALKEIEPAQRQFIVAQLGGADAVRAFGLAAQDGVAGFDEMNESIVGTTAATDLAAARMQGFTGDIENLSNQASSLGTTLGGIVIPPLSLLVQHLADVARVANFAATELQELALQAKDVGGSFADQIPFLDRAEGKLGEIAKTVVKFQLFGPTIGAAALALDKFGGSAEDAAGKTTIFDGIIDSVTESINGLSNSIKNFQGAARPTDAGLNVQQVLNRITGFDSAEVRARIADDTQELLSVLQDEQAFLEAQLQRDFVKRRPGLQRQLENALFGVVQDIASISAAGAADAKSAAADAAKAIKEADQVLLDALSQRREDFQRRISSAGDTEGLQDDIRRQDQFQALIKIQIAKIRARIKDEQARKEAIRELRIALIASQQEEAALRQQQAQERAAAKQEGINLDIQFAEITGNVAREIAARQRLIGLLRKQQAAVKKGTAEWKRLRNEIAAQKAAIKDARGEAEDEKKSGKTAQQFFFEQLQAQQGFASNLLGNLITGPTAGLVGVPSPTTPGATVDKAARTAETQRTGPTSGQANTTNTLLERILDQLRHLNGEQDHPEATHQRRVGRGSMDNQAM